MAPTESSNSSESELKHESQAKPAQDDNDSMKGKGNNGLLGVGVNRSGSLREEDHHSDSMMMTDPTTSSTSPPTTSQSIAKLAIKQSTDYLMNSKTSDPDPSPASSSSSLREPPCNDLLPLLSPTPTSTRPTLADFRRSEGPIIRAAKLRALWNNLPTLPEPCEGPSETKKMKLPGQDEGTTLSFERAKRLQQLYKEELAMRVREEGRSEARLWGGDDAVSEPIYAASTPSSSSSQSTASSSTTTTSLPSNTKSNPSSPYRGKGINWKDFRRFLWDQEKQLWDIFQEMDMDQDGRLGVGELRQSLERNGIRMSDSTFRDFVHFLSSGSPVSNIPISNTTFTAPTSSIFSSSSTSDDIHLNPMSSSTTTIQGQGVAIDPIAGSSFSGGAGVGMSPEEQDERNKKDRKYVTFTEFRDFLMLMPRKASVREIYKFYQVRKRFEDGRGAARVNMDGDLNVSFPKTTTTTSSSASTLSGSSSGSSASSTSSPSTSTTSDPRKGKSKAEDSDSDSSLTGTDSKSNRETKAEAMIQALPNTGHHNETADDDDHHDDDGEEDDFGMEISANVAWKFLLAGGVAGAVSRTATAPFDRLKVYLITATDPIPPAKGNAVETTTAESVNTRRFFGAKRWDHLAVAANRIYKDGGGIKAFWVGNGLNVTKIFPESAIKFFSYEYSKRVFARYWDEVHDQSDISGTSRFISGGIGGITSQLSIYPIETLKTQLQSHTGPADEKSVLMKTVKHMWKTGGMRAYYRGLTLGLIGVFPYSAIDMSTFEALKIAYCKSFDLDEPQTAAVLCFGALSGSIGATSVYPINLLRTRLQASGSTGHPQLYTGFWDVMNHTLAREGWQGLYKGLVPTLAKVVPAVSISYVVYEHCKRSLHIS